MGVSGRFVTGGFSRCRARVRQSLHTAGARCHHKSVGAIPWQGPEGRSEAEARFDGGDGAGRSVHGEGCLFFRRIRHICRTLCGQKFRGIGLKRGRRGNLGAVHGGRHRTVLPDTRYAFVKRPAVAGLGGRHDRMSDLAQIIMNNCAESSLSDPFMFAGISFRIAAAVGQWVENAVVWLWSLTSCVRGILVPNGPVRSAISRHANC